MDTTLKSAALTRLRVDGQVDSPASKSRIGPELCAIFIHAGAGYHSVQNEKLHLEVCAEYALSHPGCDHLLIMLLHAAFPWVSAMTNRSSSACIAAMAVLKNGGSAVDAVEISIRTLEDRDITNAGFGSNLAMDGTVECDATIVDHFGRSGAVGAVGRKWSLLCLPCVQ